MNVLARSFASDPLRHEGALWLVFVAWPLWRAGTLAGSDAEEMTFAFAFVPVLAAVVPWGYVWREYVRFPRAANASADLRTAT